MSVIDLQTPGQSKGGRTINVCFFTSCKVRPTLGGTERITYTVAQELKDTYGCRCFNLYELTPVGQYSSDVFTDSVQLDMQSVEKHQAVVDQLKKWNIDILIHQAIYVNEKQSESLAATMHSLGGKYVFCLHFSPLFYLFYLTFREVYDIWRQYRTLKNAVWTLLYPFMKYRHTRRQRKALQRICTVSDRVVFLSKHSASEFVSMYGIKDTSNLCAINNSLSFDTFFDPDKLREKEHTVLIVARMDETFKRISIALQIWKEIEQDASLSDWRLVIVGDGQDLPQYKTYVEQNGLTRVSFEGSQPPEEYYRKASVFMLTSRNEGWGLTLTEAQQFGCVPIAFDTYATLSDIITDGENGRIIPEGERGSYRDALAFLMHDEPLRHRLAVNAISSSHRFEKKTIIAQWWELIFSLTQN